MSAKTAEPSVCHVITGLDIGGAEMMLKRLLEAGLQTGARQTVVSLTSLGKIGVQLQAAGIRVYTLGMRSKIALPVALWRLVRILRELKPDVVQTWMYHADLVGGVAARICGIRAVIWGIHCTVVPIGRPLTYLVMKLCAWLSGRVPSVILCVAEAARQNHCRYGYAHRKMRVIPNGFQTDVPVRQSGAVRQQLKTFGLDSQVQVIGCVGRFHADKGQDIFLQAAAKVLSYHANARFVLAGRGCDTTNAELLAQIERLQLNTFVHLLGERDDIPALLTEFDYFCLPSRSEAFPVALGEAMLAALPCVATRVGDCDEMVGDLFPLVNPADADALAQGLISLLNNPASDLELRAKAGRDRIIERYSIAAVAQKYRQLQLELTEG